MRLLYKLKACETKSIISSVLALDSCEFFINENTQHAKIRLNDTTDKLLEEALNQVTPIYAKLDSFQKVLITNESRYIWKLNPELKINKMRLKLLRQLKPLGILFAVRNTTSKIYLKLTKIDFVSFQIKWAREHPTVHYNYEYVDSYYNILFDTFEPILQMAINKYIIDDSAERKMLKEQIRLQTLNKLNDLIS